MTWPSEDLAETPAEPLLWIERPKRRSRVSHSSLAAPARLYTHAADARHLAMSTVTAARMTVAGRAARASTEARNTKPSPPISRVESKKAQGASRRASLTRTRATDEKDAKTSIDDETVSETVRRRREASKASKETAQAPTLNPLDLGRRARQLTDGFFKGITGITQLARSPSIDEAKYDAVYSADLLSGDTLTEYETPNARFTISKAVMAGREITTAAAIIQPLQLTSSPNCSAEKLAIPIGIERKLSTSISISTRCPFNDRNTRLTINRNHCEITTTDAP